MKLRRNEYLPNPQIALLLRSRAGAERTQISAWCSAHRRSAPPQGISRTPIASRDAEAAEPKNRRARREVRNLPPAFTDYNEIVPDHIEPKGMGGAWRDDHPENIQAVHRRCNLQKGSRRLRPGEA